MKRKNPICAYKRLLANDHDWDYGYLIALEKKKLQRMHNYMKHEGHLENNDIVVRDIGIYIRLIDIFMEEDAVHDTWLDHSFSGKLNFRKLEDGNYVLDEMDRKSIADFPVYINVRNKRRFFRAAPIKEALSAGKRNLAIYSMVSLRQLKALHLYHLIRAYKLLTWWD